MVKKPAKKGRLFFIKTIKLFKMSLRIKKAERETQNGIDWAAATLQISEASASVLFIMAVRKEIENYLRSLGITPVNHPIALAEQVMAAHYDEVANFIGEGFEPLNYENFVGGEGEYFSNYENGLDSYNGEPENFSLGKITGGLKKALKAVKKVPVGKLLKKGVKAVGKGAKKGFKILAPLALGAVGLSIPEKAAIASGADAPVDAPQMADIQPQNYPQAMANNTTAPAPVQSVNNSTVPSSISGATVTASGVANQIVQQANDLAPNNDEEQSISGRGIIDGIGKVGGKIIDAYKERETKTAIAQNMPLIIAIVVGAIILGMLVMKGSKK